jgi:hypothetical protein
VTVGNSRLFSAGLSAKSKEASRSGWQQTEYTTGKCVENCKKKPYSPVLSTASVANLGIKQQNTMFEILTEHDAVFCIRCISKTCSAKQQYFFFGRQSTDVTSVYG